jgi:hypothetical protein
MTASSAKKRCVWEESAGRRAIDVYKMEAYFAGNALTFALFADFGIVDSVLAHVN